MFNNVTQEFKNHLQSRIRHLIFNGEIQLSQQPMYHITTYKIHTLTDFLAIHSIYNIDKINIELHYIMRDEDTRIHIQENDTEFVSQMYALMKTKYIKQHVK